MRSFRSIAALACVTFAAAAGATADPPLVRKALLAQVERLTRLLSDAHASGNPAAAKIQVLTPRDGQQWVLSLFVVEGQGGGNSFTQFLAVFETDTTGKVPYYTLVDVIPVGGKGWRLIEKLDARATPSADGAEVALSFAAMAVTENDAPNFPKRKTAVHLVLKDGRLIERTSVR